MKEYDLELTKNQKGQEKLIPSIIKIRELFPREDADELKRILVKLRKILSDNVKTQI